MSEETLEVFRFDTCETEAKYRFDSQGFMHLRGTLTTVGVYKYRNADGSIRREFRPPEEVLSERFLNSLKNCVLTNEHPPNRKPVTIRNVKKYQVGHVASDVEKVENLRADSSIVVTDVRSIQEVASRTRVGLSVGYRCKTRKQSGVWMGPNGPEPYDYVQSGHVANHVCLTKMPRGGMGDGNTQLHLDSLEAEQVIEEHTKMEMVEYTVDGVTFKVPVGSISLIKSALDKRDSTIEEQKQALTDLGSKLGTLEADHEKLKTEHEKLKTDSEDAPDIGALIKARMELNASVSGLLSEEELGKLDSAAADYESTVIDAVLTKHGVDIAAAEKLYTDSTVLEAYKRARFDALVDSKSDDAHDDLSSAVHGGSNVVKLKTDSKDEPAWRKQIRKRVAAAQQKRDGILVEENK